MGRIARLVSFVKRRVVVDSGGGPNITVDHFSPPGDDSEPMRGDHCVVSQSARTGGGVTMGYRDTVNDSKSDTGEKRMYARDKSSGITVVEVWLKNDGTCIVANSEGSITLSSDGGVKCCNLSGSFDLKSSGDFVVNGVTIDTDGNIKQPLSSSIEAGLSLKVGGVEMSLHSHLQGADSDSNTQAPVGPPV